MLLCLAVAPSAWAAYPDPFLVESTAGVGDANPGNGLCATAGGMCTLQAAIEESNATGAGQDPTIGFAPALKNATTAMSVDPPPITRSGTFVDGCGVGRSAGPFFAPNEPASDPCVGLQGSGANTGLTVSGAGGVVIQGLAMTKFAQAIRLLGADTSRVAGNWFGLRRDAVTQEPNDVAVAVAGIATGPNHATGNIIGGASDANDSSFPACDRSCNVIIGSTVAGIDLTGGGPLEIPAGGTPGDLTEGTSISGNWIGIASPSGLPAAPNATAILIGNAQETTIGGANVDRGNVIAGNTKGVDQGAGTTSTTLLRGSYGISPDGDNSVPNGSFNARLRGSTPGYTAFVQWSTFGPTDIGLDLEGPKALVVGNAFFSPDGARFGTAAIRVGPDGDQPFIGSDADSVTSPGCIALVNYCNQIYDTGPGVPGIWIDGADNARIWRNGIGGVSPFLRPIDGPGIRIGGGATGASIGDDDGEPARRNLIARTAHPAVEVSGSSTKVVVGGNEGVAAGAFDLPSGLFTDLIPAAGPGNSGPVNNGIQPPVITLASINGLGGTATPGATIQVLQQQRKKVLGETDPFPYPEGYTFPTTPSTTTAGPDGVWGVAFDTPLKSGQKLLASQTTTDGSSEYATPLAASPTNPPPLVTFTGGPVGVVGVATATFTFTSNKTGSKFECSLDAADWVACGSPYSVAGLSVGGHQLRVRATDPIGTQGPPASRTWSVEIAPTAAVTPKAPAKIRVLRAGVKGGVLDMLVEITSRATTAGAKLAVTYRSSGRTSRFDVAIANTAASAGAGPRARTAEARISFRKKLPVAQRKKTTGIVELRYAGNDRVRPDSVRLRAASGKSRMVRKVTTLKAGRLTVSGTVTSKARGVVRIRLGYDKPDLTSAFLYWNVKISKGKWKLSKVLPAAAAKGGQLSIQFTGYLPRKLRGEQTAKQILG